MAAQYGNRIFRVLALTGLALAASGAPTAHAEIAAFRVDGTITSVRDPDALSLLPVAVGDAYSVFYSFDTEVPGVNPRIDNTLRYERAILAVTLEIAGIQYAMPNIGVAEIQISDNQNYHPIYSPYVDAYGIHVANSIIVNVPALFLDLGVRQETEAPSNALTSLALTGTPPDLSLFSNRSAAFQWFDFFTNRQAYITGTLDAITPVAPVPLPAPLWLLASVLLSGAGFKRLRAG